MKDLQLIDYFHNLGPDGPGPKSLNQYVLSFRYRYLLQLDLEEPPLGLNVLHCCLREQYI
jgi:hypothetical protein